MEFEVAAVSPVAAKVRVYEVDVDPAKLRPEKFTIPDDAATVVVPDSVPADEVTVTEVDESVVTVLPPLSAMRTTG